MPSHVAIIASPVGLHARPATEFSRRVAASGVPITVGRPDGTSVNGASVLAVMALGIKCGERVVISSGGTEAEDLLEELVDFLQTEHDATAAPPLFGHPLPAT